MKYLWWACIAFSFYLGIMAGSAIERRYYQVAEDKTSLIYEGSVYVRVVEGTALEDYLTAAGKK